jgi:MSHA biogenesis protein MshL
MNSTYVRLLLTVARSVLPQPWRARRLKISGVGERFPARGSLSRFFYPSFACQGLHLIACALLLAMLILVGCASKARDPIPAQSGHADLRQQVEEVRKLRQREQALEQSRAKPEPMQPVLPEYDPLDDMRVTLSAQDQRLTDVLYALADSIGLSLVINPDVNLADRVTIRLVDTPASTVLESLLAAHDVAYERRDDFLVIKRYIERSYELGFLNREAVVSMDAGGDVFGNSMGSDSSNRSNQGGSSNNNLNNSFKITDNTGQGIGEHSLYGMLRANIEEMVGLAENNSARGQYFTLDATSGTLYVRATPSRQRAVSELIRNIRRKVSRQVIIDAWMVEVRLSSQYRLGVDWQLLTQMLVNNRGIEVDVGWNPSTGTLNPLTITNAATIAFDGATAASATLQALESFGALSLVSSPHVRVKHGQPALFTSGRSQNYVHSISKQRSTDNNDETFSVEVRTLFDGIMLGVIPFVDDNRMVDLQIYPVESRVDPGSLELVDVTGSGDRITLPKVQVKNISTNVRARDGDTIVLGGLIDKSDARGRAGLIGASNFPLTGTRSESAETSELVIIMDIRVIE